MEGRREKILWTVGGVIVVIGALFPVLWILSLSLKPASQLGDNTLIPQSVTLENYEGIFKDDLFTSALRNSIGIALIATVIAITLAAMAAYALTRLNACIGVAPSICAAFSRSQGISRKNAERM